MAKYCSKCNSFINDPGTGDISKYAKYWRDNKCYYCDTILIEKVDNTSFNKNSQLVCPHCQKRGYVNTKFEKFSIPQPKFEALDWLLGILTGGIYLIIRFFTDWLGGPYYKWRTMAHCSNCGQSWQIKQN